MYNEQLENLINAALADGVLTEKEKQILLKKAQSLDIDLDEFEMVLDARLYELNKRERVLQSVKDDKNIDTGKLEKKGSKSLKANRSKTVNLSFAEEDDEKMNLKAMLKEDMTLGFLERFSTINSWGKVILWILTLVFVVIQIIFFGWWSILSGLITIIATVVLSNCHFSLDSLDFIVWPIVSYLIILEILFWGWWAILLGLLTIIVALAVTHSDVLSDVIGGLLGF